MTLSNSETVARQMLAGRWELTRTEGIEDFLSTMGLGWATRKVAAVALSRGKATVIVKMSSDVSVVTLRLQQGPDKPWHEFDLITDGEERENTDEDGNTEKNAGHWDSQGRLVQDTVGKRGKMTIIRYLIDANTMVAAVCAKPGAAQMLRYYDRVGIAAARPVDPSVVSGGAPVDSAVPVVTPSPSQALVVEAATRTATSTLETFDVASAGRDESVAETTSSADNHRVVDMFLTPPFVSKGSRSDETQIGNGIVSETKGVPFTHQCSWEQMVQAYLWRMMNNRFVKDSTVTAVPTEPETLAALGAFQFNIALKVPWMMRSVVGGENALLIERGRVNVAKREMTLICTNVTWGATVQFVQVCTYTALPGPDGGGCHFSKTISAELFNPMIPKWAVDSFWKMNGSESAKSRLDHEELAQELIKKPGMLDDQTKALVRAIGLDVDRPQKEQLSQPDRVKPDGHTVTASNGHAGVVYERSGVVELEQSVLAAVITAQQLANQLLDITDRWVASTNQLGKGQMDGLDRDDT